MTKTCEYTIGYGEDDPFSPIPCGLEAVCVVRFLPDNRAMTLCGFHLRVEMPNSEPPPGWWTKEQAQAEDLEMEDDPL
jgi:hypothetical protein